MQNFRKMGALLGASAVIISLAGCGGKAADDASTAASGAANLASDAGAGAANAATDAGAAASNAASNAGAAMTNAAANASNAAAGAGKTAADAITGAGAVATLTPGIKTELGKYNNSALKGSKIDVTTDAAKKTVTLTGSVKTAAQKTLAGTVAGGYLKKNAADFKLSNQLAAK